MRGSARATAAADPGEVGGTDPSATPTAPAPTTTPPTDEPDPPSGAAPPCGDVDRDRMAGAVRGQLAAIAADDWAGALAFTSTGFREGVDEARFEAIIEEGFPVVAAATAADVTRCVVVSERLADVRVTVEDGDGTQQDLSYVFEREDGVWLIAGAVPTDPGDDGMTI